MRIIRPMQKQCCALNMFWVIILGQWKMIACLLTYKENINSILKSTNKLSVGSLIASRSATFY